MPTLIGFRHNPSGKWSTLISAPCEFELIRCEFFASRDICNVCLNRSMLIEQYVNGKVEVT